MRPIFLIYILFLLACNNAYCDTSLSAIQDTNTLSYENLSEREKAIYNRIEAQMRTNDIIEGESTDNENSKSNIWNGLELLLIALVEFAIIIGLVNLYEKKTKGKNIK